MPHSMTAFARVSERLNTLSVTIEMRSVNHRFLDISPRIPELFRHLEAEIREAIQRQFKRGKIDIWITYELLSTESSASLNQSALAYWLAQLNSGVETTSITEIQPPNWQTLLGLPGVIEHNKLNSDDNDKWFLALFAQALDTMRAHRAREGEQIAEVLTARLHDIERLVTGLQAHVPTVNATLASQLRQKIDDLHLDVDAQRFEQELVFLLSKADVGEELDRLRFHVKEARHALGKQGAVGRRLDFLMQEFNREANTLGAKAADNTLSQASVELKVLIEQMREQIQNLE